MNKKITIRDIAQAAGVSVATVSFVMNNEYGNGSVKYRVSKETTEKILKIAKRLNYKPNNAAQSLRSGKSNTIGVIVSDISNNFYSEIARCIEDNAYRSNYTVFFGSSDENPEKLENIVKVLIGRGIDGLIIVPCENSEKVIKMVVDARIPLVLIDRTVEGVEADTVVLNNRRGAAMLTENLINKGMSRIEMVSYSMNLSNIQERESGYRSAMADAGLAGNIKVHKVRFQNMASQIQRIVNDIMSRDVEGLVFATNSITIEAVKDLHEKFPGFQKKVSLAGFDGSDAFSLCNFRITHIKQPIESFGSEAVRILLDSISNAKEQIVSIALNPQLVE